MRGQQPLLQAAGSDGQDWPAIRIETAKRPYILSVAPEFDALFNEFDTDGNDSLSFRELNRQLRRKDGAEKASRAATPEAVVEIADMDTLRRDFRRSMLAFSNASVPVMEDPLTGLMLA